MSGLPPIPNDYFLLIGQIAAVWSRAEYILQCTVVSLICELDQSGGMMLTANIGYQSRCDLLRSYWSAAGPEDELIVKEWKAMLNLLKDAYARRNAFVHGLWANDEPSLVPRRLVLRPKGRLTLESVVTETSDGEAALQMILMAEAELLRLADSMHVELGNRQALGLP